SGLVDELADDRVDQSHEPGRVVSGVADVLIADAVDVAADDQPTFEAAPENLAVGQRSPVPGLLLDVVEFKEARLADLFRAAVGRRYPGGPLGVAPVLVGPQVIECTLEPEVIARRPLQLELAPVVAEPQ